METGLRRICCQRPKSGREECLSARARGQGTEDQRYKAILLAAATADFASIKLTRSCVDKAHIKWEIPIVACVARAGNEIQ